MLRFIFVHETYYFLVPCYSGALIFRHQTLCRNFPYIFLIPSFASLFNFHIRKLSIGDLKLNPGQAMKYELFIVPLKNETSLQFSNIVV